MQRKLMLGGIAACAALTAAAPAHAIPVPLQFDHVVIDTPATPYMEAVSPSTPGGPLKATADVDVATGDFTVAPSDFDFPEYSFTQPVPGTLDITLPSPASGHVDFATGKLSLTGTFDTKVSVTGVGDCTVPFQLTMNTETTKPLPGFPFPPGATGPISGNGAFGTGWDSIPDGTGSGCSIIKPVVDGSGGIWISRGIDPKAYETPTGAPKLALALKKPKAVKSGKKAKVKATVSNTGDGAASGVKVCLTAPKPLKPKSQCKTVGALAAASNKVVTFTVKTKKHKKGKFTLKGKASGTGIASATAKTTLKVKK